MVSVSGRLLVASPMLNDPNFARTVVLMLAHNEDGALGLVLNRPSDVDVDVVLADAWPLVAPVPPVLFLGGPVAPDSVIGLARVRDATDGDGFVALAGGLGTVDLERSPEAIGGGVEVARVFAGHAGWAPGQLDGELAVPGWIVLDAEPDDPFTGNPDELWRSVLARQEGHLAWLANFPDQISAN